MVVLRWLFFFGIPTLIIGSTIVAFGTSAPELVTSIVASRKGEVDIAIGNVVGSNIFNVLFILGLSSVISPISYGVDSFIGDSKYFCICFNN